MTTTYKQEVWVSPEALTNNYGLESRIKSCDTIEDLDQVVSTYNLISYEEFGYMHITDAWEHDSFQSVAVIENFTWDNDVEEE